MRYASLGEALTVTRIAARIGVLRRRRTTLALALALAALIGATGTANGRTAQRRASRAEHTLALRIARSYWRHHAPRGYAHNGEPLCGRPRVRWSRQTGASTEGSAGAEAFMGGSCRIIFYSGIWEWPAASSNPHISSGGDTWAGFCTVMVHEVGHLILGPTYFAASNPSDPAHSPDPRNVMYWNPDGTEVPACLHSSDPTRV